MPNLAGCDGCDDGGFFEAARFFGGIGDRRLMDWGCALGIWGRFLAGEPSAAAAEMEGIGLGREREERGMEWNRRDAGEVGSGWRWGGNWNSRAEQLWRCGMGLTICSGWAQKASFGPKTNWSGHHTKPGDYWAYFHGYKTV
jgi:hypothetical protein